MESDKSVRLARKRDRKKETQGEKKQDKMRSEKGANEIVSKKRVGERKEGGVKQEERREGRMGVGERERGRWERRMW